jgi:glucose-6-phosphate 1-dehydrogenase
LKAMAPLDAAKIVRGQFHGYLDEKGVAGDSKVETFAALEIRIRNWRWAGVPFFIRAGKCMATDAIEVRVQFKLPPHDVYRERPPTPEYFRFRVGPGASVLALGVHVKAAGESTADREIELLASDEPVHPVLPYERLLGDAMRGDASLFAREDSVEAQWRVVDPALKMTDAPLSYEPGTWGPTDADRLLVGYPGGWVTPIEPAHTGST